MNIRRRLGLSPDPLFTSPSRQPSTTPSSQHYYSPAPSATLSSPTLSGQRPGEQLLELLAAGGTTKSTSTPATPHQLTTTTDRWPTQLTPTPSPVNASRSNTFSSEMSSAQLHEVRSRLYSSSACTSYAAPTARVNLSQEALLASLERARPALLSPVHVESPQEVLTKSHVRDTTAAPQQESTPEIIVVELESCSRSNEMWLRCWH